MNSNNPLIDEYILDDFVRIDPELKTFEVNQLITVYKLFDHTYIFINKKRFRQCKFLMLNIPVANISDFTDINSIDEAVERLDRSLEQYPIYKFNIDPETEFWAHCSNLQAWAENNYDTRLLHSSLSFPLLDELTKAGDPIAKKVFKEEIAKRLLDKPFTGKSRIVVRYLKYLKNKSNSYFSISINEHGARGVGYIIADQNPSKLLESAIDCAKNKILFQLGYPNNQIFTGNLKERETLLTLRERNALIITDRERYLMKTANKEEIETNN